MGIASHVRNLPKTNNRASAATAKTEIRRKVLEAIGADAAHVFDAFAGDGHMWRTVWHAAAGYVGCDKEFYVDERIAFVGDNRRVMRAIDLRAFNVFDLDSYGSPWEQLYILAARRPIEPGERIGLVLTEGTGLKMKMGGMPLALATLASVRPHMHGLGKVQDELINRGVAGAARLMAAEVQLRWQAASTKGSAMRYIGMVLQGR